MEPETTNLDLPAEFSAAPERPPMIDWSKLLAVFWNARKLISRITALATVAAIVVSLLLPEYFRSSATLLPETETNKLAALGGLSDLAALAGISVGGEGSLAKLYPTIMKSESVLRNVILAEYQTMEHKTPVSLIKFWEIEEETPELDYEHALKALRDALEVSLDTKTSIVTVAIETREPQLSADIVNKVLQELDGFIRTQRTTSASEQRKWIEGRLGQVKDDLERSENTLKEFRQKNRRITDSPNLLLEQGRLQREVEINSTLYTELKKQFEIAKIEEIKNIPIINVMDPGKPAARKANPKRMMIVAMVFFASFFFSSLYALGIAKYGTMLGRVRTEIFSSRQGDSGNPDVEAGGESSP
jgi:uncharacterized protein involved in exopolysaccharide biosynthesis